MNDCTIWKGFWWYSVSNSDHFHHSYSPKWRKGRITLMAEMMHSVLAVLSWLVEIPLGCSWKGSRPLTVISHMSTCHLSAQACVLWSGLRLGYRYLNQASVSPHHYKPQWTSKKWAKKYLLSSHKTTERAEACYTRFKRLDLIHFPHQGKTMYMDKGFLPGLYYVKNYLQL